MSTKRKLLAAREDLADRMSAIASRKGLTLYSLVNEALEYVITLDQVGLTPESVIEECRVLHAARNAGFALAPENLWYEMVDQAARNGYQRTAEGWFEAGARCGKLYLLREIGDPLNAFTRDIRKFTWNASAFDLEPRKADGELFVRCISPKLSESYADMFGRFLEGAFAAFGYGVVERDVSKGALQLKLTRKR